MPTHLPCGRKSSNPGQKSTKTVNSKSSETSLLWRDQLTKYLKKMGLRATSQRENVAEVALSRHSHFEIQELIKDVQKQYPEISPATVYRSVATLCDAGILHETLESSSGVKLYEPADGDHHDHIVCLDCGEIFEFHDEGMEKAQDAVLDRLQFKPERHRHILYARCGLLQSQIKNK
jgi:Fur family ferric uptake transcriptional regulator